MNTIRTHESLDSQGRVVPVAGEFGQDMKTAIGNLKAVLGDMRIEERLAAAAGPNVFWNTATLTPCPSNHAIVLLFLDRSHWTGSPPPADAPRDADGITIGPPPPHENWVSACAFTKKELLRSEGEVRDLVLQRVEKAMRNFRKVQLYDCDGTQAEEAVAEALR